MKKTILTLTAAFLCVVVSVNASEKSNLNNYSITDVIVDSDLNTFCKAIMKGDVDTVKKLIELGEDVNKKSLGLTPAMFAARYNKAEILELLIAHGANLKIKSDRGFTAKKYAELSNAVDALAVLEASAGS